MEEDVAQYIWNCYTCARAKLSHQSKAGILKPLDPPANTWEEVSIDFVTGLPTSKKGNDTILVVVDRLTEMQHFILCSTLGEGASAPAVAKLYLDYVRKHHCLPKSIVSDQGKQFDSLCWRRLSERLGIKVAMSTASYPQTDGQRRNANAVMEQYLGCYVRYLQEDLDKFLPLAKFAHNNA
jgi:transposase InsO family protein